MNGFVKPGAFRVYLVVGNVIKPLLLNNTMTAFFGNDGFLVSGNGVAGDLRPIVDQ